jgi:nuclear migration protein JNM1
MAEAPQRKYTNLPGIDTAPDIYETPDLVDDASTIQASTAVSESGGDSEEDDTGISRSRLQTDQARSRFQPARVDARGVDFSDNITAQHRSYRTSTRGQRRRGEVLGDDSDDEQESFSRKLMRVKREAEELEAEFQQRLETGDKSKIEERDPKDVMEYISNTVDAVYAARRGGVRGAEALLQRSMHKFENYPDFDPSSLLSKAIERQPPIPGSHIQRSQLDYVLDSAAEIDTRLTTLEDALGLNGSTMPDISNKSTLPVFATLEKMEQTVDTLANASSGSLDSATQHVRKLIQDAEQLKELRQEALRQELTHGKPATTSTIPDPEETERQSKINALYGTLPTINKLSPMLPIILDRIRTLRLVHTTAFQADEILTELEKRQAKQEDEIEKWRISLDNVLTDVKNDETNLAHNMKVVGDWVKNLEERIEKLPLSED